jgi:hypothetical protein
LRFKSCEGCGCWDDDDDDGLLLPPLELLYDKAAVWLLLLLLDDGTILGAPLEEDDVRLVDGA